MVFLTPLAVDAQSSGKVRRIGYLASGAATAAPVDAFRNGLRELGWLEGRSIVVEYRFSEGRADRLPGLAAELVRQRVEVIVAAATAPTLAAKSATATLPIVMVNAFEPDKLGLITSFARPGGNVTGLTYSVGPDITGKMLELLKEAVPKVRHVAILSNPANPAHASAVRNVQQAAGALGLKLQLLEAAEPGQFDAVFAAVLKERADALLVLADAMFVKHRAKLGELASRNRIPVMHGLREHLEAGGLLYFGPDIAAISRRVAFFVDKILKGTKPADLPVEQPTKFELGINLRTAKSLGLAIPQSVLVRADQVIE
jgi:putative ABC transport system substrate-binding protein